MEEAQLVPAQSSSVEKEVTWKRVFTHKQHFKVQPAQCDTLWDWVFVFWHHRFQIWDSVEESDGGNTWTRHLRSRSWRTQSQILNFELSGRFSFVLVVRTRQSHSPPDGGSLLPPRLTAFIQNRDFYTISEPNDSVSVWLLALLAS